MPMSVKIVGRFIDIFDKASEPDECGAGDGDWAAGVGLGVVVFCVGLEFSGWPAS